MSHLNPLISAICNGLLPCWVFLPCPCPPLYIWGDRITWKVLAEYSWSPTTTQLGSFLFTAAGSTPIRVVTIEVRYINELSLSLEHSMPITSPAARVWQAPELFVAESYRRRVLEKASSSASSALSALNIHHMLLSLQSSMSSSLPSTSGCFEAVRC